MERRASLLRRRLAAQQIAQRDFATPREVVSWLGAVQAQDYAATKWAVGLRVPDDAATETSIEQAIANATLVRTHALRGTWQLIAPDDVRWMLALVGPRLIAGNARRYQELELDTAIFRKSAAALTRALRDGTHLTRAEVFAVLEAARIAASGQRLTFLLQRAELDGLICSGARLGKQRTYALLEERVPPDKARFGREEGLAELARRYFRSRGPATVDDFIWWSGLAASEARAGHASVESTLAADVVGGRTYFRDVDDAARGSSRSAYLLPAFDEYLVAYRNREAMLDPKHAKLINAGGGMLEACIVLGGRVIGTWHRVLATNAVTIELSVFEAPTKPVARALAAAARRYGAFVGLEATMKIRMSTRRARRRNDA